jgi:hypothetical protein
MALASAWWKSTTAAARRNTFSASLPEGAAVTELQRCISSATFWGGQRPGLQEKSKKRVYFAVQNGYNLSQGSRHVGEWRLE